MQGTTAAGRAGVVSFGLYELDMSREELRRNGVRIKLQQQPFAILRLLLTRHGQFVSKQDIRRFVWPDDHFVDFEQSINTAVMKLRYALRENAASPVYIETVPRRGYRFIAPITQASAQQALSSSAGGIQAIAILPLQELSATPEDRYFAEGLTDSLRTEMALRSGVRVVPRATTERYWTPRRSMRELAQDLDVQAVVEGSILRSGERVRISARLLHALEERHMWAQTYERDMKDILLLQQDIVAAIATSADLALQQDAPSPVRRSILPAAYDAFLKANFLVSLRAPKALERAMQSYQAAISLEPAWAPPYAGLAEAHRIYDFANHRRSAEIVETMKSLTESALRLDPYNVQAQATMGAVLALHEWKWEEGEKRIELALRANPHSAEVERLYAVVLLTQGRYDEALAHIDLARLFDQSSLYVRSYRIQVLLLARRYQECLLECEDILEENPSFTMGRLHYGAALLESGRGAEALPLLESSCTGPLSSLALALLAIAHAAMGDTREARGALARIYEVYNTTGCSPVMPGLGHAALHEDDKCLELLQDAAADFDVRLPLLIQIPVLDRIRSDTRYQELMQTMRLG